VSCRLACGLLGFIIVAAAPICSVGVVAGVVGDVGHVVDTGDANDAGGVGVLVVATGETILSDRAGTTQAPGLCEN
jgi:hypothetical protein